MSDLEITVNIAPESASVQTHLSIMQNIIQRMATNCSACKAWCITLVSAILVMIVDKGKPEYIYLALFPIIVFAYLDAYYLALEKAFQNSYNNFIRKLHTNTLTTEDLYAVKPMNNGFKLLAKCGKSISVWVFYIALFILVLIVRCIISNV